MEKLVIFGTRTFLDFQELKKVVESSSFFKEGSIRYILSGKARGADSLGEHWAKTQNIAIKEYPANWTLYGKSAGLKRNKRMAKEADCGIAFWDGVSTGTQHMIKELRERQIPVLIYNYKAKTSSYLYYSDKR